MTIDHLLEQIRVKLNLSKDTEWDVLEEIRGHLEDAVDEAQANGDDKETALLKAAEKFGVDEVAPQLQAIHEKWESTDAIMACIIPVFFALVLRWMAFSANGTALGWQELLTRPAFWIMAIAALIVPLIKFRRWPYALVGWAFFWMISIIFVVFPRYDQW